MWFGGVDDLDDCGLGLGFGVGVLRFGVSISSDDLIMEGFMGKV